MAEGNQYDSIDSAVLLLLHPFYIIFYIKVIKPIKINRMLLLDVQISHNNLFIWKTSSFALCTIPEENLVECVRRLSFSVGWIDCYSWMVRKKNRKNRKKQPKNYMEDNKIYGLWLGIFLLANINVINKAFIIFLLSVLCLLKEFNVKWTSLLLNKKLDT